MTKILDGRTCSKEIEAELKETILALKLMPSIALLLVGTSQDSKTYIRLKKNACTRVGITSQLYELSEFVGLTELLTLIQSLNANTSIHGILLQLPLPNHLKSFEKTLLETISPYKDVDGLHSHHFARLAEPIKKGNVEKEFRLQPCTPAGCIEILARRGIELTGKNVVVVGRGQLVGLPLSLMLLANDATVTMCHSKTTNLTDKVRQADIVVIGIGQPELVKGEWLAEGVVVVDVGINYVDDASSNKGHKIVGDVHFASAIDRVSAITPVPGGIGPMTIAMLLKNTIECARFAALHSK